MSDYVDTLPLLKKMSSVYKTHQVSLGYDYDNNCFTKELNISSRSALSSSFKVI